MALPQTKFRELVFQILFRSSFTQEKELEDASFYMQALKTSKQQVLKAKDKVTQILRKTEEIDQLIKEASVGYELERIQAIELNILRLMIYELLYTKEIDLKVGISEGVRLAKKFSQQDATKFIHALLDHIYKKKMDQV